MEHHSDQRHHGHGQDCSHRHPSFATRWLLSVLMVGVILISLRSFLIGQMFVRLTSYSAYSYYNDAIRICKKIIAIDPGNKQAWTALGFSYMDEAHVDGAIRAFGKVLELNPHDQGAASFELGQAYFLKKDYVRAIDYFKRVRGRGPRAGVLLDADILRYRHGVSGFQSVHSMRILLGMLIKCYQQTGDTLKAAEVQKEYDFYKNEHKKILF
ncbi:MAG: tetratricopeptide repeat protein [Candidatus Omnitrophica bacterium]|nr:tetratricopeptide repeat protein [Candidatus Omnitrophota bacterium]